LPEDGHQGNSVDVSLGNELPIPSLPATFDTEKVLIGGPVDRHNLTLLEVTERLDDLRLNRVFQPKDSASHQTTSGDAKVRLGRIPIPSTI